MKFSEIYDFVVVGSSGGGICAALTAHAAGKRTLIIEKASVVGGTTALSGGMLWIPNSPVLLRRGVTDSLALAKSYLDACCGDAGTAASQERRMAFLEHGPKMITFLESLGMRFVHGEGWSCYHEGEMPGGLPRGRSICADVFDLSTLKDWQDKILQHPVNIPVLGHEAVHAGLGGRNLKSLRYMARVGLRLFANWFGRRYVGLGLALQGRLLKLALDCQISILTDCSITGLIQQDHRVVGVAIKGSQGSLNIGASAGVLLAAGGFSRNRALREEYQPTPSGTTWTHTNQYDNGDMILAGVSAGGQLALMDQAVWMPTSVLPSGRLALHGGEMSRPHCILVDGTGRRYVNESASYVVIGQAMYERHQAAPAIPSWCVMDGRFLKRYRWGGYAQGRQPIADWVRADYLKRGKTIADLAGQCGIDANVLQETVAQFNRFAADGRDAEFHRGLNHHNRFMGDPSVHPNPALGPIDTPPFYAVKIFPGDVGTCGGLLTDEHARVLRADGSPVAGLYATGNSSATPFGKRYPGAGASIGPALVFGFIAAKQAAAHHSISDLAHGT